MKLLKKEVGILALSVIKEGEASESSLLHFPGVSANKYDGPEVNRTITRKNQAAPIKQGVSDLLSSLRRGGIR